MKANLAAINTGRALLALALLSLVAWIRIGYAQEAPKSEHGASLRSFLAEYLGAADSQQGRTNTRYLSANVDLNGDGRPETIVYILGSHWCGSGGCSMLILKTENAHYKVITRTTVTRLPVRVLSTSTHGWSDIAVTVAGGCIRKA